MNGRTITEAMRYGADARRYEDGDLGKFGLGLKTASMSRCRRLTVASRTACRETGHQVHCGAPDSFVVMVEQCKDPVDSGDCVSNRVSQRQISRGSGDVLSRKRHRTSRDATEFVSRCPHVRWNMIRRCGHSDLPVTERRHRRRHPCCLGVFGRIRGSKNAPWEGKRSASCAAAG